MMLTAVVFHMAAHDHDRNDSFHSDRPSAKARAVKAPGLMDELPPELLRLISNNLGGQDAARLFMSTRKTYTENTGGPRMTTGLRGLALGLTGRVSQAMSPVSGGSTPNTLP